MSSTIDQIRAAIAAIEAGKPDDEVNRLCALAFGWEIRTNQWTNDFFVSRKEPRGEEIWCDCPFYTTSLDAIMAEMPDGWLCTSNIEIGSGHVVWRAMIWKLEYGVRLNQFGHCARAGTEERARLKALLRAMGAQADAS